MAAPEPWQLLPELTEAEYAALKADVAERGVVVPVVVDAATGTVIDGHHRLRAWTELRAEGHRLADYPREVRTFADDDERAAVVVALNLARRHLSQAQRRELVADLRRQGWSLRRIAGALSTSRSAVARDLGTVPSGTLPERIVGTDGRSQPARRERPRASARPALFVRSRRDEGRARAALDQLGPEATSPANLLRAEELARIAHLARRRAEVPPVVTVGPNWRVQCCDFADLDLEPGSVDAIVCDPPYTDEAMPVYSALGAFAVRVLKPGRVVVAYCGNRRLPDGIARLGDHLEWVWAGAVMLSGRNPRVRDRMVNGAWRPVLICSAGRYQPRGWLYDAVVSPGRGEKAADAHPWQQSVEPFRHWVRQVTKPGEVVVDPFLGAGTTGVAALAEGRRFIGCDVDPACVAMATERLAEFDRQDDYRQEASQ